MWFKIKDVMGWKSAVGSHRGGRCRASGKWYKGVKMTGGSVAMVTGGRRVGFPIRYNVEERQKCGPDRDASKRGQDDGASVAATGPWLVSTETRNGCVRYKLGEKPTRKM